MVFISWMKIISYFLFYCAEQIKISLEKIADAVRNFWNSVKDRISENPKIAEKKWKISIDS